MKNIRKFRPKDPYSFFEIIKVARTFKSLYPVGFFLAKRKAIKFFSLLALWQTLVQHVSSKENSMAQAIKIRWWLNEIDSVFSDQRALTPLSFWLKESCIKHKDLLIFLDLAERNAFREDNALNKLKTTFLKMICSTQEISASNKEIEALKILWPPTHIDYYPSSKDYNTHLTYLLAYSFFIHQTKNAASFLYTYTRLFYRLIFRKFFFKRR